MALKTDRDKTLDYDPITVNAAKSKLQAIHPINQIKELLIYSLIIMLHVQLQMSMLTRVTMGTMGTKIHPKALHLQLTIRTKILTQGNPPKTHMLGSQQKIHMPDNLPKTLMLVSQLRKTHTMQESQRRIHTMQLKNLTQGVSQRSLTRLMEEMVEEVKRRLLLLKEL